MLIVWIQLMATQEICIWWRGVMQIVKSEHGRWEKEAGKITTGNTAWLRRKRQRKCLGAHKIRPATFAGIGGGRSQEKPCRHVPHGREASLAAATPTPHPHQKRKPCTSVHSFSALCEGIGRVCLFLEVLRFKQKEVRPTTHLKIPSFLTSTPAIWPFNHTSKSGKLAQLARLPLTCF